MIINNMLFTFSMYLSMFGLWSNQIGIPTRGTWWNNASWILKRPPCVKNTFIFLELKWFHLLHAFPNEKLWSCSLIDLKNCKPQLQTIICLYNLCAKTSCWGAQFMRWTFSEMLGDMNSKSTFQMTGTLENNSGVNISLWRGVFWLVVDDY